MQIDHSFIKNLDENNNILYFMQIDHIFIKNLDENNNILGWTPPN